jgi:hypothetical protein
MENISLYSKIALLPDQMKAEVADFIDFLAAKAKKSDKVKNAPKPKFGSGKGMFIMAPDFDEPLDDFKEYMH